MERVEEEVYHWKFTTIQYDVSFSVNNNGVPRFLLKTVVLKRNPLLFAEKREMMERVKRKGSITENSSRFYYDVSFSANNNGVRRFLLKTVFWKTVVLKEMMEKGEGRGLLLKFHCNSIWC